MKPGQAVVPFLSILLRRPRTLLKALLKFTKEQYRAIQFGNKVVKLADIHDIVGPIDESIKSYTYLDGTSRTSDIAFLKAICRQYEDCNYLEIGSWRGESLVNVADVTKKCTSVSLSKKEMVEIGLSKEDAEALSLLSRDLKNVKHIEANSRTFDFDSLDEKFDVIFIDGDHSYEGVKSDTKKAFNLLRDDKSVIVWHDCGFSMQDLRFESITAIYDACSAEQFENFYRVSNTMCGIYTRKQIKTGSEAFKAYPNKVFDVHIKSSDF